MAHTVLSSHQRGRERYNRPSLTNRDGTARETLKAKVIGPRNLGIWQTVDVDSKTFEVPLWLSAQHKGPSKTSKSASLSCNTVYSSQFLCFLMEDGKIETMADDKSVWYGSVRPLRPAQWVIHGVKQQVSDEKQRSPWWPHWVLLTIKWILHARPHEDRHWVIKEQIQGDLQSPGTLQLKSLGLMSVTAKSNLWVVRDVKVDTKIKMKNK